MSLTSPASGSIPAHSVAYDYDDAGRKLFEENLINGATRRVSYEFNEAGSRSRTTWPDGYFVAYQYDALNRIQYVRENSTTANEIAFYDYDSLSRRKTLRYAGQPTNQITYTYEPDGDLDLLTNVLNAVNVTLDYGHNRSHQINQVDASDDFYLPSPVAQTSIAYVPDKLNRYASVASSPTSHDRNGNLLTWGPAASLNTYTYDPENRLRTAVVTGGSSASYDYDSQGRRLQKSVDGTSTYYLLDGNEEIAEYSSAGTVLRRYITGAVVDDRIAAAEGGAITNPTKTYFHVNHQGSVIAMTDSSGNLTGCGAGVNCQRLAYDEYGNLGSGGVSTGQPYRFTGRRFDVETGLYYYRARYYSPALGRFLQSDPVGYQDDLNLYAYVRNDPLNLTDPSGTNCVGDGTTYTCDPPGDDTPAYQIPQMEGMPNEIGDTQPYSHVYRAETSTPDANGSLAADLANQVIANPTPGNDQPATPGGTVNDAGITPFSGALGDQVRSYVSTDANGNTVVANVTIPGEHVLSPGIVSQYVIPGQTRTSIVVVGEGNGVLSIPAGPIAQRVFQSKIESDMRTAISRAVREGRW